MKTKSDSEGIVTPIKLSNLLNWAIRTVRADKMTYRVKTRPMTFRRFLHLLRPNLSRPIFILGAPRSGTTFLGRCLAEIPEISYHFEPVVTKAATRYVFEGDWGKLKAKLFFRSVYAWLMRLHFDGDLRFAEKTPRNCMIISFLFEAFPLAQFIHIIRDGRDASLSYSKKPWLQYSQAKSGRREPGGYLHGPYARLWVEKERKEEFETTSDIHRCIWAWRRHVESVIEFAAHLSSTQYLELRYEKLVANPVVEAAKLLDFLEIIDSKSRSIFYNEISKVQSNSVGRWKMELSNEQLAEIYNESGKILKKLGYVD